MGRIQQGRYDELLRRTTAQYGGGSKLGEALEDLFPVIDVESLPMELLRACKWHFGQTAITIIPQVGTVATIQLFNPVGSSRLAVITKVILNATAITTVVFGPSFTTLTDSVSLGAQRDLRDGVIRGTICLMQEEDDATPSLFGRIIVPALASVQMDDPNGIAVLAPGTGYRFAVNAVTLGLTVTFFWRERVALPEELDF